MPIIKLSPSERRRLSVFLICLGLAAVAWVLSTLQGLYNYKVAQLLVYNNIPQKRSFRQLQSDTVEVTLQGSGWKMLFSKMHAAEDRVYIDLRSLETKNYIVLNNQLPAINSRRNPDQKIISFNPDTLYFDFTNRSTKKVPVKVLSNITYQQQYNLSGSIKVFPQFVTISGPGNIINKINYWETDSLKGSAVNESFTSRLNLKPVNEANLNVYPKSVQVKVPVEEFTEKVVEVPVKVTGNLHFYDVKLFPQKVKVSFMTPLSRYAELDADFFDATADLSLWSNNSYTALPVQISHVPAYSKIVKVEPQNIDFIVKK